MKTRCLTPTECCQFSNFILPGCFFFLVCMGYLINTHFQTYQEILGTDFLIIDEYINGINMLVIDIPTNLKEELITHADM